MGRVATSNGRSKIMKPIISCIGGIKIIRQHFFRDVVIKSLGRLFHDVSDLKWC